MSRINKSPKAIAYSFYDDLRKAPSMQYELAEAATLIETAVLHVRRWCDDIAEAARRRGPSLHKARADAHGSRLCHGALPRSGRVVTQRAGRIRFRQVQSNPAGVAR